MLQLLHLVPCVWLVDCNLRSPIPHTWPGPRRELLNCHPQEQQQQLPRCEGDCVIIQAAGTSDEGLAPAQVLVAPSCHCNFEELSWELCPGENEGDSSAPRLRNLPAGWPEGKQITAPRLSGSTPSHRSQHASLSAPAWSICSGHRCSHWRHPTGQRQALGCIFAAPRQRIHMAWSSACRSHRSQGREPLLLRPTDGQAS